MLEEKGYYFSSLSIEIISQKQTVWVRKGKEKIAQRYDGQLMINICYFLGFSVCGICQLCKISDFCE